MVDDITSGQVWSVSGGLAVWTAAVQSALTQRRGTRRTSNTIRTSGSSQTVRTAAELRLLTVIHIQYTDTDSIDCHSDNDLV